MWSTRKVPAEEVVQLVAELAPKSTCTVRDRADMRHIRICTSNKPIIDLYTTIFDFELNRLRTKLS